VSKKVRNKFLRNQKVLTGRTFDISVLKKPRILELVEMVRHQGWMHLMEGPIYKVFDEVIRELYSTLEFSKYNMNMIIVAQGKKLNIDVTSLGRILDILICGVRTISKQQTSIDFLETTSMVRGKLVPTVNRKSLKSEL